MTFPLLYFPSFVVLPAHLPRLSADSNETIINNVSLTGWEKYEALNPDRTGPQFPSGSVGLKVSGGSGVCVDDSNVKRKRSCRQLITKYGC